ncbi:hypothetical protein AAIA72_07660 [Hahella sp. SMD15-11]|uniref:Lipoprotein n=1 Tax=Thermohahella caldifontis TaxID=3142973 RepID=A0AB39V0W0_9GAMM
MARIWMLAGVLTTAMMVSGCDSRPFENYSNYELSQEYQSCQRGGLSPAGAQRCNNIIKECEIRKEEKNFRC